MGVLQWMHAISVLLALGTAHPAAADICTITTGSEKLPSAPKRFHITMATVSQPGDFVGHASLMVDEEMGRAAVNAENFFSNDEEFKVIYDMASDQVMLIDRKADEFQIDNCQLQTSGSSNFQLMAKIKNKGADRMVPSGKFLTPPEELRIDKDSNTEINGIQTTPYRACYSDSLATVEVTWWYPIGSDSPIQIKSMYQLKSGGNVVTTTYTPTPMRNLSEKHDAMRHPLMAPKGVYCKDMVSSKKAPEPNNRFGFSVEEFVGLSSGTPSPIEQPYNMHESYDQQANITMMEGDATLFFATDKGKYGTGRLAKINDFSRGISYIKNMHYGNCSFDKIPEDSWDATITPGGARLKSPAEFYFPSLNELQYKGSGIYRDTDVDVFIGYKDNYVDIGDGKKYPKTTSDMDGNPKYEAVPRGIYSAVAQPLRIYTMTDVFDYNTKLPRVYEHDISDCFSSTDEQHFELILTTSGISDESHMKYLKSHLNEFFYSLVAGISKAINISPLRVLEPKLSLFAEPLMLVEVTISERANVPGYTPSQPESTLAEVAPKLTEAINKKTLYVQILDGEIMFDIPVNDFVQMDARRTEKTESQGGLSPGAAAGLSIGMLILGALIALLVIFGLSYFRNNSVFGFKPFGNGAEG
uniref:GH16 domain-containing protein n=1 Tax=Macrostomum lignano TaxID=282301 RepID=A0A1I8GVC2_9PLAT